MISGLPDDLLVEILLLIPIKEAVATMILSKRWRSIWTMMPELEYKESNDDECKSVWNFLDKSLQLHKAPVLRNIVVELGVQCPVDVDVGKWIKNAVDRNVRRLIFDLNSSTKPISLPKSLFTCNTLVCLSLSHNILVDLSSPACLPSLTDLALLYVVFKDDDSLVWLLSSCPILKNLRVDRHKKDNVKNFKLNVPSQETLWYMYQETKDVGDTEGSLVIDSPNLKTMTMWDLSGDSGSIENTPRLDKTSIYFLWYPSKKCMTSLSSNVLFDILFDSITVAWCTTINFYRLVELRIQPYVLDWLEPLMVLIQNTPKLKILLIDLNHVREDFPLSWNQPGSVPKCLLTHLEVFEWKDYGGRSQEKELARYILANSKCLKRVAISFTSTCNPQDTEKMMDELKSMSRISESSQLMFTTIILHEKYHQRFT